MNNNLSWLILFTLKREFRKASNLIIYFGLPIAGVLVSMLLYGNSDQGGLSLGIVNAEGSEVAAADTVRFISGLDHVRLETMGEKELHQRLYSGKLDGGVIIEEGYSASLLDGEPEHIVIESVKGAEVTAYLKAMLNGHIGNMVLLAAAADGDPETFKHLLETNLQGNFQVETETVNDHSDQKQMTYQSIGFLILFMMTSAVNLSELILNTKEDRTYFRIISSPVSSRTYVAANIAVNLFVMLAQTVFTLICLQYVFRIDSGIPVLQLMGLMMLFALNSVSISLVIVAFSKNRGVSGSLQNLIIIPSCMLAGCFFPPEVMPSAIRKVSDFMPQSWVLKTIQALQNGRGFAEIALYLGILLAFALVFFLIAIYQFGRNNDIRSFR